MGVNLGRAIRLAGGALLVATLAHAAGTPRLEATPQGVRWHGALLAGTARGTATPVAAWWNAARDTGLVGTAVLVSLADSIVAHKDTVLADSLMSLPRLKRSLWAWDALRRRAIYRLGHADTLRAARLLEAREGAGWLASEEAAWSALLATLRVALRDTLGGEALARALLEDHVTVAPASGEALALLDRLARRRGERFALPLARRAARAEWANGQRAQAVARLARVLREAPESERGPDALQRVQWLREWRRPVAAIAASDTALRWTRGTPDHARLLLERARALRDDGRTEAALATYTRLAASDEDARVRVLAWWEGAREAQDESRWGVAARMFRSADSLAVARRAGTEIVREALSLAGLMDWMAGRRDEAVRTWRARSDRRARFWLGVALRQRRIAEGDSILRAEFAERPGFDLYASAARDTLGLPSWPGVVVAAAADTLEPRLVESIVRLSGPLALPEAAARIVAARDRGDARLPRGPQRGIAASSWRAIAVAAYAGGDLAGATRAADRAMLGAAGDSTAWDWIAWAFPPAYEASVRRAADAAGIEHELLWALVRQESRFDARAVSRSNARGLTQLLAGTAKDVARSLKESLPADTLIFDPDRSLRYGARYLKGLLDRFDGNIPVALTAYNAGPGKVRADWRELLAHGGWALYCEMAANADTQDYVRRILGYRQAYRELRPASAPGP